MHTCVCSFSHVQYKCTIYLTVIYNWISFPFLLPVILLQRELIIWLISEFFLILYVRSIQMGLRGKGQVMVFWFNKWYSKQRNDYNAVVRLILMGGFRLPDSHSPASTLALSLLNSHSAHLLHPSSPASQLTLCTPFASVLSGFSTTSAFSVSLPFFRPSDHVSRNARGQGHAGPFHETTHLKRPNDTLMYPTMPRLLQLCLRFDRYLRPNILVSPILHVYALYNILRIIIFFLIGKTTL